MSLADLRAAQEMYEDCARTYRIEEQQRMNECDDGIAPCDPGCSAFGEMKRYREERDRREAQSVSSRGAGERAFVSGPSAFNA